MARRKYHKGEKIFALLDLVKEIEAGHSVFMRDKLQNAKWLMNMSLATLAVLAEQGDMALAIEQGSDNG